MKKFVLANGILIDKVNNLCYEKKDILVENGRIVEISDDIDKSGLEVLWKLCFGRHNWCSCS